MFWNKVKSNAPEIILLGATAFLQFFRLGIGEIISWDESLYLIRAEACVKFGAWLDQTQYAIGGLYSSTHPPLVIWLMAFTRMIFGNGVFASRMISASAAVVALYFFYKLASRFFSRWTRLFATVSLGSAQGFLWYSHHAQLDIPMFAFIVATAYFAVRAFDEADSKMAVITGVLYACALLTKAFQPLYLLPFLFALPFIFRTNGQFKKLVLLLGTAAIITLPWYIFMVISHSDFYSDYAGLVGSMKAGTYAKESTTHWWYYINQLIIDFPFLILVPLAVPSLLLKWKRRDSLSARISIAGTVWLLGMLIFVSVFQTRMPHFVLFLFLPATLVVCVCIEEVLHLPHKSRNAILSVTLLLPVILWSGSELIRKSIREHYFVSMHSEYLSILAIVVFSLIITALLYKYFLPSLPAIVFLAASLLLFFINFFRFGNHKNETYIDGVQGATDSLFHHPEIHSLIAYEDGTTHEAYLPELNYYSGGWLLGWDSNRMGTAKSWAEIDSLIKVDRVPRSDAAIIFVSWDIFYKPTQEEIDLVSRINKGLREHYKRSFQSKKYQLYWEPK